MKHNVKIVLCLAVLGLGITACKEKSNIPMPGDNEYNISLADMGYPKAEGDTISVGKAVSIANGLAANATTKEKYYIIGRVKSIDNNGAPNEQYGNATFDITDGIRTFKCYRCIGIDGAKWTEPASLAEGDDMVVYGQIQNYQGNTPELKSGSLVRSTNPFFNQPTEIIE